VKEITTLEDCKKACKRDCGGVFYVNHNGTHLCSIVTEMPKDLTAKKDDSIAFKCVTKKMPEDKDVNPFAAPKKCTCADETEPVCSDGAAPSKPAEI